jgi:hypothetical protein
MLGIYRVGFLTISEVFLGGIAKNITSAPTDISI